MQKEAAACRYAPSSSRLIFKSFHETAHKPLHFCVFKCSLSGTGYTLVEVYLSNDTWITVLVSVVKITQSSTKSCLSTWALGGVFFA